MQRTQQSPIVAKFTLILAIAIFALGVFLLVTPAEAGKVHAHASTGKHYGHHGYAGHYGHPHKYYYNKHHYGKHYYPYNGHYYHHRPHYYRHSYYRPYYYRGCAPYSSYGFYYSSPGVSIYYGH